ncbi:MAG TPA: KEOPS complex subunit Pcc1 [Candidatus Thermoplasmatota archaeon]|nr:KEOPS complex subunit Pcc1 [Candidatus Thermoplasmatota archaeon]
MPHRAELELPCASADAARWVLAAVAKETESGPEGTTCSIVADGAMLRVRLEAGDVASLRAALQGVVRLVDAAHRVVEG